MTFANAAVSGGHRTMIASDLDRTLIYSPTALQLPTVDEQSPNLVSVEVLDGRPHSFMTLAATRRLADVSRSAVFVPTTTRTMDQYLRVRFPAVAPEYAITSNGGNILVDGKPDLNWHRSTESVIAGCGATLSEVRHELKLRTNADWALKRRVGDDLFCYLVVELTRLPDDFIESWTQWCHAKGWRVSVQGRKIYAIPVPLTKERAMAAVARRIGAGRVVAAGDGALDSGFLAAADAGIRPPHGELAALNWQHPTVDVGPRAGVLAADDIISWFSDQIRSHAAA
jgi:hydroxymethylpyrimidine pyrophosphatase-like HAD family hydrolase